MDVIKQPLRKVDKFQQKYKPIAFAAAVIKKYSDEDGGRLTALITYYVFLSLFPLLLVATASLNLFLRDYGALHTRVTEAINTYFPAIGETLQASIQGFDRSGLALLFGVLVAIYGARGGAATVRYAFNTIWNVPKKDQLSFPVSALHSLMVVFIGGGGLIIASVLSTYAAGLTNAFIYRLIPFSISLIILVAVFYIVFGLSINSKDAVRKDILVSAIAAAIGVQILQAIGSYLVTHQLKELSSLYGTFAIVLGLLFWIYLQTQVLLLAAFAGAVHSKRLWPRKLFW